MKNSIYRFVAETICFVSRVDRFVLRDCNKWHSKCSLALSFGRGTIQWIEQFSKARKKHKDYKTSHSYHRSVVQVCELSLHPVHLVSSLLPWPECGTFQWINQLVCCKDITFKKRTSAFDPTPSNSTKNCILSNMNYNVLFPHEKKTKKPDS